MLYLTFIKPSIAMDFIEVIFYFRNGLLLYEYIVTQLFGLKPNRYETPFCTVTNPALTLNPTLFIQLFPYNILNI